MCIQTCTDIQPLPPLCSPSYHSLYPTEFADVKSKAGRMQLLAKVMSLMKEWGPLLKKFVKSEDDEVDMLLTLEELCGGEGVFEGSGERAMGRWGAGVGMSMGA